MVVTWQNDTWPIVMASVSLEKSIKEWNCFSTKRNNGDKERFLKLLKVSSKYSFNSKKIAFN
jgi:hypothetical protein